MPVMVRNQMPGPTVLTLSEHPAVILETAGDPMGGDLQRVPDAAAEDVNFLRAIDAGMITIESAPEAIREALASQLAASEARRDATKNSARRSLETMSNRDLVQVQCIGPNATGRGQCTNNVAVSERTLDSKPPLCTQHGALAPMCTQVEQIDAPLSEDGKTPSKWKYAAMQAAQYDPIIT